MEEGREDRVTEVEGGKSNDQHLFGVRCVCLHACMHEYVCVYPFLHLSPGIDH